VTMLRVGRLKKLWVPFPAERILFPLALRLTQTHVKRFCPLKKEPSTLQQQACEADHSLLSTTDIMNAWSLTATSL
jgi:hypothetical protein